jgi:hypothetical protein
MKVINSQLIIDALIYKIVDYAKVHAMEAGRIGFNALLAENGLEIAATTSNRWLNPTEVRHKLPGYALPFFVKHYQRILRDIPGAPSALTPLTHIAHQAGYRLQPINPPKINGSCLDFFQAVAKNQKESADFISAAAEGMADGKLERKELIRIQKELLEQMEAVSLAITMVNGEIDRV